MLSSNFRSLLLYTNKLLALNVKLLTIHVVSKEFLVKMLLIFSSPDALSIRMAESLLDVELKLCQLLIYVWKGKVNHSLTPFDGVFFNNFEVIWRSAFDGPARLCHFYFVKMSGLLPIPFEFCFHMLLFF